MNIKQIPAHENNYGVGRAGKKINKVVLHWIVGTLESADATFQNPNRRASAHYGIGDGDIHQYVKESDTAWHASSLAVNQESIGIEHEGGWIVSGTERMKPTEETHKTSSKLVADICSRYNIPIDKEHILPHNKFSSTQCPGTLDIDLVISLAKNGSAIIPPTVEPINQNTVIDFQGLTAGNGYETYNKHTVQEIGAKLVAKDIKMGQDKDTIEDLQAEANKVLRLEQERATLTKKIEELEKGVVGRRVFSFGDYVIYNTRL